MRIGLLPPITAVMLFAHCGGTATSDKTVVHLVDIFDAQRVEGRGPGID